MTDALPAAIAEAAALRAPEMLRTPLSRSEGLSKLMGCNVLLKCEHLQTTGSFKYRGAANKIRLLSKDLRQRGVVTASSGNHGQAVALAGRNAGVAVTVYVSRSASPAKLAAIRSYGAELILMDAPGLEAELEARHVAESSGRVFVSPYNDLDVIAGQGTIGVELLEQAETLDAVFLSVGGGGLASGVGSWLKATRPETALVGCWPANSTAMLAALEAGYIHDVPEQDTFSDGTAGGIEEGTVTFPLCAQTMGRRVAVSEAAIARAMWNIADHERWIVEGAAGVALAGLEAMQQEMRGKTVAVVLCGRNVSGRKYLSALTMAEKAGSALSGMSFSETGA